MPSARLTKFVSEITDSPPKQFVPSSFQQAVFSWFGGERNKQHLYVKSRAGTGKSTTILKAIDFAPEDNILLCAFNKSIADTLSDRLNNPKAHAQTLHSLGYQAIRRNAPDAAYSRMCAKRFDREDWLATQVSGGLPFGAKRLVAKLTTKARELEPIGATAESLAELAMDFDLLPPVDSGLSVGQLTAAVLQALQLAKLPPLECGIDYADMVYLPLALDWFTPAFDLVVVDEAQDMTKAQMTVARSVLKSYGAIVLVADPAQSIYSFRGADCANLERLTLELDAEELPLSRTYRCPKRVVQLAQRFVPDFEVDDRAPEGTIDSVDSVEQLVKQAQPGDFVLSRTNAPLARIAMALLRADKRVRVMGRDIGAGLRALVKRLATGHAKDSIPKFLEKLSAWEAREITRLVAMQAEDKVPATEDRAATLRALAHEAVSVTALDSRIDYLFSDNGEGAIVCGTVHRLKGTETSRAFLVRSTFFRRVMCECGHRHKKPRCFCGCADYTPDAEQQAEEARIYYVAITRVKQHLTWLEEQM